jgi:hypothetical protein
VQQHVTIRVPAKALVVSQSDAANPQWNPKAEFVGVEAVTDSHVEIPATDSHGFPRIFWTRIANDSTWQGS